MTVSNADRWQLPDGVDELLPLEAWRVERFRRHFMDQCHDWGYELVMPPLIEYIDSLLTGTGETLNLQTFKIVDQQNGRTLGVRADITPQVARIDANALRREEPSRLFYIGTVLRAQSDGFGGNRSPQQLGAELFGHSGAQSDIEIIRLMLETVMTAGLPPEDLVLDLGHVGVYRALVSACDLDAEAESRVFDAIQRGSVPDLEDLLAALGRDDVAANRLVRLMQFKGDVSILATVRDELGGAADGVDEALDTLDAVVAALCSTHPKVNMHVDLGELRGYRYHTGMLFAVHDCAGESLAHGGRYDSIGESFGHPRPATGFSGELMQLARRLALTSPQAGIHVPDSDETGQWTEIMKLRAAGERVVPELTGTSGSAACHGCDRELVSIDGRWQLRVLDVAG